MKITKVEAIVVRQGKIELIGDGTQDTLIILVHTDSGITGIGEVDSAPFVSKACVDMPASHSAAMGLAEIITGMDPFDNEVIWDEMFSKAYYYARGGAGFHAISGIDMAIWDIKGKALGMPVYKLLGGAYQKEIPAYVSILMPDNEDDIKRLADYHMQKGYKAIKFGWGALGQSFDKDIKLIRAARKAIGDEAVLMIDIGMAWKDIKTAIKTCKAFEEYNVFWVEEPFECERTEDFQLLRQNVGLNIAGGEELSTLREFKRYADMMCVDILQPDISRCGGITMAKKIYDIARLTGINVIPHNFKSGILMAATLQFIASVRDALFVEYCGQETVLSRMLVKNKYELNENGKVLIPDMPGLGVELDMEVLQRYRVV